MKQKKFKQKLLVLYFIIVANICVFVSNHTYEVNKFHSIEQSNAFRWQKFMNEDEYSQIEEGMTYMNVVELAKGRGEKITDHSFIWRDEILLTQSYLLTFNDGKLVYKQILNKKLN